MFLALYRQDRKTGWLNFEFPTAAKAIWKLEGYEPVSGFLPFVVFDLDKNEVTHVFPPFTQLDRKKVVDAAIRAVDSYLKENRL